MSHPLDLYNITQTSTNNSLPIPAVFGLQNALNARFRAPGNLASIPTLFPDACRINGTEQNCTTVCSQEEQMFSSLDTLHNCLVWPLIQAEAARNNISASAIDLASPLGFVNGTGNSTSPSEISNRIQTCLLDSCSGGCAKAANKAFPPKFQNHFMNNLTGGEYLGMNKSLDWFDPCRFIDAPANADIAGIGVFISYVMQVALILFAFVLALPWKKIATTTRSILPPVRRKVQRKENPFQYSEVIPLDRKASDQRSSDQGTKVHTLAFNPAAAVVPTTVELQKAQCYFMLATNIAGLIVQGHGGVGGESLQELYNTYIFIKVVAIGGYLPVTFGLLILRMLDKVGWSLLILSIVSVGVATGNLYRKQTFNPSLDDLMTIQQEASQGGPATCGEKNPIAWCYKQMNFINEGFKSTNQGDGADLILGFSLVLLVLITIEHFWSSNDPTNRKIRGFLGRHTRLDRFEGKKVATIWHWRLGIGKYIRPVIFVTFVAIYIYSFVIFANDLDWLRVQKIYDPGWTFGQIVAILAWAPPIIEYIWLSICKILKTQRQRNTGVMLICSAVGIEDGSDNRLPNGFEVRKKEV
ncbi:hypothetical protein ACLMJK_006138 [Lecanora helva]